MATTTPDEYGKPPDYVRTTGPVDLMRALTGAQSPRSSRIRSTPPPVEEE